ncbi:avidin [Columba guinea]|nr:avidin [Columba guinea]
MSIYCPVVAPSTTKTAEEMQSSSTDRGQELHMATTSAGGTIGSLCCCHLLTLALLGPCTTAVRKWELEGHWINSMCHLLIIGPVDQQGRFNGTYIVDKPYTLKGFQHSMNQNSQILELEFTVYWSSGCEWIRELRWLLPHDHERHLRQVPCVMALGSQYHTIQNSQPTFGFTINWSFSVLHGQGQEDNTEDHMNHTEEADSLEDDWKANGLQLQPYKGGQAGHRAGREPCWTLHSSIAMGSSAFTLVLVLALVTCVTPAERKCQLSGLWRNEQDSLMEISAVRDNGDFQGKYLTRVTLTGSCAYTSPLKGAQQQPTDGVWPTFAFTVHWDKFSNATTAFTGQCFVDTGGKETLTTMWLLREAVGSLEEDWKATR